MSYTKHTWVEGENITLDNLNNIETGVETIDTGKMDKVNPTGSGKLTMGNSYTDASSQIGYSVSSTGDSSHAEGYYTSSSSYGSHAEGMGARATNWGAHAEGARAFLAGSQYILASGKGAHAEGFADAAVGSSTNHIIASGDGSHAEGSNTEATAYAAHAEGVKTKSSGQGSHSEGVGTEAKADGQHVEGKYNNTSTTALHIVGNGITETNKSNAYLLESDGTGRYKGDVYVECNADSTGGSRLAKVSEIKTNFNQLEGTVTNSQLAGEISNDKLVNKSIIIAGSSVSLGESISAETLKSNLGITNVMHYIGKTTTTITDGSTTNPITINGSSVTAVSGDVVIDNSNDQEYVWNGAWQKLGGSSSYKVKQTAVPSPSASGTATAFIDTISQDTNGNITVTKKNIIDNDTKNTAGSTNTTDTIYLIGAKTQAANPQTYSNSNIYVNNNSLTVGSRKLNSVIGNYSSVLGCECEASGECSHAEGDNTKALGNNSHAEGYYTYAGKKSHAEGDRTCTCYEQQEVETLPSASSASYGIVYKPTTSGIIDKFSYEAGYCYAIKNNNSYKYWVNLKTTSIYFGGAHSEGTETIALDEGSHAEGYRTFAGQNAHSEGDGTEASGKYSHAEGDGTIASGESSHAEGSETQALGYYSHAEGKDTIANGPGGHAEGDNTYTANITEITVETLPSTSDAQKGRIYEPTTNGTIDGFSYTANYYYIVWDLGSTKRWRQVGDENCYISGCAHAEGDGTLATVCGAHAEGYETYAAYNAHSEGDGTEALGISSHAEGYNSIAHGECSHVEGLYSHAGYRGHAEGSFTYNGYKKQEVETLPTASSAKYGIVYKPTTSGTIDDFSYQANYYYTVKNKNNTKYWISLNSTSFDLGAHSEGQDTIAIGEGAHSEGHQTFAGIQAHSEGKWTEASGENSHAEGYNTTATGENSHAEGNSTKVSGHYAHVEGYNTIALKNGQHVQGSYNVPSSSFIDIIGNGYGDESSKRSNAFALDGNGTGYYKKDIYVNCNSDSTGGNKVISEDCPFGSQGTYVYKCVIDSSGTKTYSWIKEN